MQEKFTFNLKKNTLRLKSSNIASGYSAYLLINKQKKTSLINGIYALVYLGFRKYLSHKILHSILKQSLF